MSKIVRTGYLEPAGSGRDALQEMSGVRGASPNKWLRSLDLVGTPSIEIEIRDAAN